jgi:aspartate/methionine/tyrosine aminotransferase
MRPCPAYPLCVNDWPKKMHKLYGNAVNADNTEITITAGGTQALYTAINALVHEGDEVILFLNLPTIAMRRR